MKSPITKNNRDQKITVSVGAELLARAQKATREGISATVRRGLELVTRKWAYEHLRMMQGKVKFSLALEELRREREY
jgi:hypothetical protein